MAQVLANNIKLECETRGDPQNPPMLLLQGINGQLSEWPAELLQGLVSAGYYVITFDSRDVGLSQRFPPPAITSEPEVRKKLSCGDRSFMPYTLDDLVEDTLGLMDALKLDAVHMLGASMGATIAMAAALKHPDRVLSLTLIMATSGAVGIQKPRKHVIDAFNEVAELREKDPIEARVRMRLAIESPGFRRPEDEHRDLVKSQVQRSPQEPGTLSLLTALQADGDLSGRLSSIGTPTLLIHGKDDPLVNLECAEDICRRVPSAKLEVIDGMGHDFPPQLMPLWVDLIRQFTATLETHGGANRLEAMQ